MELFYSEHAHFTVVNSIFNSIKSIFRGNVTKNEQHPTVLRSFALKITSETKIAEKLVTANLVFIYFHQNLNETPS